MCWRLPRFGRKETAGLSDATGGTSRGRARDVRESMSICGWWGRKEWSLSLVVRTCLRSASHGIASSSYVWSEHHRQLSPDSLLAGSFGCWQVARACVSPVTFLRWIRAHESLEEARSRCVARPRFTSLLRRNKNLHEAT